ncbi:hypothetical protein [Chlorobium sp.]|uniref:hypothetical protein n=1 Tax=Chlorobium sp. TaxID=1095 RepID=UPI003C481692
MPKFMNWFMCLGHAREVICKKQEDYNVIHQHNGLGRLTPEEFMVSANGFLPTRSGLLNGRTSKYIEAHHIKPASEYQESSAFAEADMELLSQNCHRAFHIYMKITPLEYRVIKERLKNRC